MAQEGLYEPGVVYEELDDLIAEAHELGASVEVRGLGWQDTPLGPTFQAMAAVTDVEGRVTRCDDYARPGDAQVANPPPADDDPFVERRAQARALKFAVRVLRGKRPDAACGQSQKQRQLQTLLREVAEVEGLDRDQVAGEVARMFSVASTAELDGPPAHAAVAWLQDRLRHRSSGR